MQTWHGSQARHRLGAGRRHEGIAIKRINAKVIEKKYDAKVIPLNEMLGSIKIDIEGGEEGMVMEYHFPHYWKVLGRPNRHCSVQRLERRKFISNRLKLGYVRD